MPNDNIQPQEEESEIINPATVGLQDAISDFAKGKRMEKALPMHVFNSELIPILEDPAVLFICSKSTESWAEIDPNANESFIYDDKDFEKYDKDEQRKAISYTEHQGYTLPGQKRLTVTYINNNGAYLPFRTRETEIILDQRNAEIERDYDFRHKDINSAFEKPFVKEVVKETLVLNFDGFIYSFYKIVSYDDREKYALKIECFVKDSPSNVKELLLPQTETPSFNSAEFETLKQLLEDRKNSSQRGK